MPHGELVAYQNRQLTKELLALEAHLSQGCRISSRYLGACSTSVLIVSICLPDRPLLSEGPAFDRIQLLEYLVHAHPDQWVMAVLGSEVGFRCKVIQFQHVIGDGTALWPQASAPGRLDKGADPLGLPLFLGAASSSMA